MYHSLLTCALDVTIIYHTNVEIDFVCDPRFLFLGASQAVKPFAASEPWNAFQWHFVEATHTY